MNRKHLIVILVLVGLAFVGGITYSRLGGTSATAGTTVGNKAGMLAPDFTLEEVRSGEKVALGQYRGRPVLINFWATWCGPCRLEMPHLQAAYETYKGQGFTVLAVDAKNDEGRDTVLAFIDELGLTFPVVKDATGYVETDLYNVLGYPTSVFIDRNGVIQYVHRGPMTKDFIAEKLRDIL